MVKAITVQHFGGAEVLKWEDVKIEEPKEGEIRIKNKAIGVNFIDILYRSGSYFKPDKLPFTPGVESAGVVTALGPGVTEVKVGDSVGYASLFLGSYSEEQILPVNIVVPVPSSIDYTTAASILMKGMTAHMLVRRTFKVEAGHTVLVHAAAGGVGSLVCRWANALGATVIGTVSSEEKAAQAMKDGCHHVVIYTKEDFVTSVEKITSGKGIDVVYDSVGKDTLKKSLQCLALRGHVVSYGYASGIPDPIAIGDIVPKSASWTWASLHDYNTNRDERVEAAREVFDNVVSGVLRVRVSTYPLSAVERVHVDMEARKTSGSIVLIPDN